jgi:hypothetical protein
LSSPMQRIQNSNRLKGCYFKGKNSLRLTILNCLSEPGDIFFSTQ